jgi:PAT family beta-lactamase induction signal transducer AmpG
MRALIAGAIFQALGTAAFAFLSYSHGNIAIFSAVMAGDNFGTSFAGVALVTYMSSLTSIGYTATQYALLSSTYAYLGKIAKGFSGAIVESLAQTRDLMDAYAIFFIGAGAIGIPALLLVLLLLRLEQTPSRAATRAAV